MAVLLFAYSNSSSSLSVLKYGISVRDLEKVLMVSGTKSATGDTKVFRPVHQQMSSSSQQIPGISLNLMLVVGRVFNPSSSFPQCLRVLMCAKHSDLVAPVALILLLYLLPWPLLSFTCSPYLPASTCSPCTWSQLWPLPDLFHLLFLASSAWPCLTQSFPLLVCSLSQFIC